VAHGWGDPLWTTIVDLDARGSNIALISKVMYNVRNLSPGLLTASSHRLFYKNYRLLPEIPYNYLFSLPDAFHNYHVPCQAMSGIAN